MEIINAVKVAMNIHTGDIGLVIPIAFIRDMSRINDNLTFSVIVGGADGYLVFYGDAEDEGPWRYITTDHFNKNAEILGDL